MVPGTCTVSDNWPTFTSAVRMPRFCTSAGETRTTFGLSALPSSAYFGTICMPIGDVPGWSKCCCGVIGSYQYKTFLPDDGDAAVVLLDAVGADCRAIK